jgi:hypothetical protein
MVLLLLVPDFFRGWLEQLVSTTVVNMTKAIKPVVWKNAELFTNEYPWVIVWLMG